MRHIGSLLAGLVVAPLAWVLIAAGQPRTEQTFERWSTAGSIYTGDVLGPLGLVVGAGLLVGLIVALRVSPLGPLVAGVFYLGVYGYAIREPVWVVDKLPQFSINGYRIDTVPPFVNGTIALAGAILVMAALSRRRWHKWPIAVGADAAAGAGAAPAAGGPDHGAGAGGTAELTPVPESPAPAGVAAYMPNEVAPGPPPAVGDGPLWPSTVGATPAYAHTEFDSPLTREAMYAGLTPGTAEDLPRRTPPKRPAPTEPGAGNPPTSPPSPPGGPQPPDTTRLDLGPAAGRTPSTTPMIPSPRHAAPTEGWPLDTWSSPTPPDRPTNQPTAPPDRPANQPPNGPADRPTIQPNYQVPPEPPATDLTQPVPSSDLTQPVPPPGQPTAGSAGQPTAGSSGQQAPAGPVPQPRAQPAATRSEPPNSEQPAPHSAPPAPPYAQPGPPTSQPSLPSTQPGPPTTQPAPARPVDHQAGASAQPEPPAAQVPDYASPSDLPWLSSPPGDPDPTGQTDPAGPPLRPINPLAQRPVSPPPAGPPRPRPVNPLSTRPAPPSIPAAGPAAEPSAEPSDSTQRLPGQPTPATADPEERPADPPTTSPWSRPPRPPQET